MTDQEKAKLYENIGLQIHSDSSPVGIDAKKTHILILAKLEELQIEIKELKQMIQK